jgi:toxin ParE1/3/4
MPFRVLISEEAERDIEDIYRYIAAQDSVARADYVLSGLDETIAGLSGLPSRGNVPKELGQIGTSEFREAHFKPYRIIYSIEGRTVTVHAVADGRRDMQSFLQRRLLR